MIPKGDVNCFVLTINRILSDQFMRYFTFMKL